MLFLILQIARLQLLINVDPLVSVCLGPRRAKAFNNALMVNSMVPLVCCWSWRSGVARNKGVLNKMPKWG